VKSEREPYLFGLSHDPRSHRGGQGGELAYAKTPIGILGILILEILTKDFVFLSGYVTNWYQSMVTKLALLGLMNELHRSSVQNTLKKSNPLS
jgi:hypothetical protein